MAAICAIGLAAGLAACGTSNSDSKSNAKDSSSSSSSQGVQMTGVSASGKLGQKPKISLHTPMKVVNNSYAVLQKGNGAQISDGDRVCVQDISINAKNGSELASTWEKNTPDCSLVMNSQSVNATYYNVLKNQKVNATVAFGVNDKNSSGTSYIMALTLISAKKAATRAEGDKVKDIPADLPKVTLDSKGKPSINLGDFHSEGKLIAQPLIKGHGKKVSQNDTIDANYTGWVRGKDGKPSKFDSSWDRGSSSSFSLQEVVSGWTKGLAGQTVGSQVLLVVPPDEGYGDKAQKGIPANSTLYFVVDILYDQGPQSN